MDRVRRVSSGDVEHGTGQLALVLVEVEQSGRGAAPSTEADGGTQADLWGHCREDQEDVGSADEQPSESTPDESAGEEADGTIATIEPPLDLAGTSWIPLNFSYGPGDTGITNPIGDGVFFEFAADGTLRGHTGCNDLEGTWEITGPYYDYDDAAEAFDDKHDGQPLTITAERTTGNECEGFLGDDDVNLLGALVATEIWWIGIDLGDEDDGIMLSGEGARVYADPA